MRDDGTGPARGYNSPEGDDGSAAGRRSYLKLVGLVIVSTGSMTSQSGVVQAASAGYGQGGYGEGAYGGSESASTPDVGTVAPSAVTDSSAELNGEVLEMGDADTVATSFEYWEGDDRSTTGEVVAAAELSSPGTFSYQVTGLSAATEYVFVARGSTENDISVQGNRRTFTTDATLQVVSNDATNIQRDSATLNGEVTSLGGADSAEAYFRFWEQGNKAPTATFTAASAISAPGAFDIKVTGLAPDTSYLFTARAKASDGDWTRGSRLEFTTDSEFEIASDAATNVDTRSATLNGELLGMGGADSVNVYFKYWEKGNRSETVDFVGGQTLSDPDTFSADVSGLDAGMTYMFAARGKTPDGDWTKGSEVGFST